MNGENNQDGANDNHSWNCGVEGPTTSPEILALRFRQMKNFATILLLADGVPMILGGDEFGRSQQGNNNAYCQDNEISWFNWDLLHKNADLQRFFRLLIRFRKCHPLLRSTSYASLIGQGDRQIQWHGFRNGQPDWSPEARYIAMHLSGLSETGAEASVFFIANAHWEPHRFELPSTGLPWRRFIDTMLPPGGDISEIGEESPLPEQDSYLAGPRSTVVLIGRGPAC